MRIKIPCSLSTRITSKSAFVTLFVELSPHMIESSVPLSMTAWNAWSGKASRFVTSMASQLSVPLSAYRSFMTSIATWEMSTLAIEVYSVLSWLSCVCTCECVLCGAVRRRMGLVRGNAGRAPKCTSTHHRDTCPRSCLSCCGRAGGRAVSWCENYRCQDAELVAHMGTHVRCHIRG